MKSRAPATGAATPIFHIACGPAFERTITSPEQSINDFHSAYRNIAFDTPKQIMEDANH